MPVYLPEQSQAEPLRVLHVASGDLWAGAEVQVFQLLRAANKLPNLAVRAVILNPGILSEKLKAEGVDVITLNESRLSFLMLAWILIQHARQWRPAVIHTHRRKEHILGAMAALSSRARGVATVHGRGEFHHSKLNVPQMIIKGAENLALTYVFRRLIAVSDDLPQDLPGPSSRKVVIPNSVDVQFVRRAAALAPSVCLSARPCNLAFLGRLVPVKQVDRLLETMVLLESARPATYALNIIGDGPERRSLEGHAAELGITNLVSFLGFQENPLPLLADSDILLFASAHEGLPMTALESLALGVPIVSPPIPSLSQIILEANHGKVSPSWLPEDLAETILKFSLPARGRGDPRRCLLPERYDIANGVQKTHALWRSVAIET
jgi:L-malate glycosyltransferase